MAIVSKKQSALSRRGNEILRIKDGNRASPSDFDNKPVALFIHGFTADSSSMTLLMSQFAESGFISLAFNYACFDGIDVASKSLAEILEDLDELSDGAISKKRIVLVGHSMGGLVARALISLHDGTRFVNKVITLGTPHDGTLKGQTFIEYLLAWSETISGLAQGAYSPKSRSALQLVGGDEPEHLLERLKNARIPPNTVDFHSISGGMPVLEFGSGGYVSRAINGWIQLQFAGLPNDGLVAESSSDLSQTIFAACAPGCIHNNAYAEYPKVNHTNLASNYRVALQAIRLAKAPPSWSS